MVAAWIKALTGVGPSMASGSQTYSGICADFPVAPRKSRRAIAVATAPPGTNRCVALPKTSLNWMLPKVLKIKKTPRINPKSIRLTMKAFFQHRLLPDGEPEADQEVRAQPHPFPSQEHQQEIVPHDQEEHGR